MKNRNRIDEKDDAQTDEWLKDNGLGCLFQITLQLSASILQARMIATNLLKQNSRLLSHTEVAVLNKFLQASSSKKMCEKITSSMCFKVMNIGTHVNRKTFKAHKQIKQKSH